MYKINKSSTEVLKRLRDWNPALCDGLRRLTGLCTNKAALIIAGSHRIRPVVPWMLPCGKASLDISAE